MSRGRLVYETLCDHSEMDHAFAPMDCNPSGVKSRLIIPDDFKMMTKTGYVYYGQDLVAWVERALGLEEE